MHFNISEWKFASFDCFLFCRKQVGPAFKNVNVSHILKKCQKWPIPFQAHTNYFLFCDKEEFTHQGLHAHYGCTEYQPSGNSLEVVEQSKKVILLISTCLYYEVAVCLL